MRKRVFEFSAVKMGGPFSISVVATPDSGERLNSVVRTAFAEVDRIENLLTDFRNSPLTRFNERAGMGPQPVPDEIYELVEYSLSVSRKTGGAFDVTYAAVGHLWRPHLSGAGADGSLPDPAAIASAKELVDYRGIILDPENRTIALDRSGMKIGMGGVGKGYAVDVIGGLLRRLGFKTFMVNGAGDICVACEESAERPWKIGLKNPFTPTLTAGSLKLSNGAVATSGDYERFVENRGKRYHHILDARTGESPSELRSVTLFAPTALQADVFATSCVALGLTEARRFLEHHPETRAIFISANGAVSKVGFKEEHARPQP